MQHSTNIALAAALFLVPLAAAGYPNDVGYVNDFADLLSPDREQALDAKLAAFDNRTTNEVLVVTVRTLEGATAREYADGLGNHWRVGKAGKNNGVVFLVAPQERDVAIVAGDGLGGQLSQRDVDRILDNVVVPLLRDDRWADGLEAGTDAILHELEPAPPTDWGAVGVFLFWAAVATGAVVLLAVAWRALRARAANVQKLRWEVDAEQKAFGRVLAARAQAEKDLKSLRDAAPRTYWGDAAAALEKQPVGGLPEAWSRLAGEAGRWTRLGERRKRLRELVEKRRAMEAAAAEVSRQAKNLERLRDRVERAKTGHAEALVALTRAVTHADVTPQTRARMTDVDRRFADLTALVDGRHPTDVDWPAADRALVAYVAAVDAVEEGANDDRRRADLARERAQRERRQAEDARLHGDQQIEELEGALTALETEGSTSVVRAHAQEGRAKLQQARTAMRGGTMGDFLLAYLAIQAARDCHGSAVRAKQTATKPGSMGGGRSGGGGASGGFGATSGSTGGHRSGGGGGFGSVGGGRSFGGTRMGGGGGFGRVGGGRRF